MLRTDKFLARRTKDYEWCKKRSLMEFSAKQVYLASLNRYGRYLKCCLLVIIFFRAVIFFTLFIEQAFVCDGCVREWQR
jgi:hypothetical protein